MIASETPVDTASMDQAAIPMTELSMTPDILASMNPVRGAERRKFLPSVDLCAARTGRSPARHWSAIPHTRRPVAQLVRAPPLQGGCRRFEPGRAYSPQATFP